MSPRSSTILSASAWTGARQDFSGAASSACPTSCARVSTHAPTAGPQARRAAPPPARPGRRLKDFFGNLLPEPVAHEAFERLSQRLRGWDQLAPVLLHFAVQPAEEPGSVHRVQLDAPRLEPGSPPRGDVVGDGHGLPALADHWLGGETHPQRLLRLQAEVDDPDAAGRPRRRGVLELLVDERAGSVGVVDAEEGQLLVVAPSRSRTSRPALVAKPLEVSNARVICARASVRP